MAESLARDLFISYSAEDRPFAQRLAQDLTTYGLRVWWDQWEMAVGDSLTEKIQDGISSSSWLAVALSPSSVGSEWVKRELGAALAHEIKGKRVFVLPLLVVDCQIPPFLIDKIYADFRRSYSTGLQALLARVAPPINPELAEGLLSEQETKIRNSYSKIPDDKRHKYRHYLYERLSSSRSEDRMAALFALSTLRDQGLRHRLPTMLSDPSSAVRRRVAFHLGRLRRSDSVPAIERLMQDENPAVRSAARTAYKEVTGSRP